MIATDGVLRYDGHGLVSRIVPPRQTFQRATRCDAVKHEIHRPDLVRFARPYQRLALGYGNLLAPPPPDMQLLQLVEPFHAFVVDRFASGLAELQMDHPDAVATVALRKFDDPPPDV